MFKIDALAHSNVLRKVNSGEKLIFTLLSILFAIGSKDFYITFVILSVNILLTIFLAKIPVRTYIKLLGIPLGFLIVALLPVVIDFQNFMPNLATNALPKGLAIALASLASLSAMYFLALTTPFVNLAQALSAIRLPETLVELMLLIYRFIFVMMETAFKITTAQKTRLGYVGLSNSYRSLALLVANLFISAYKRANETFVAMTARNYNGNVKVLMTEDTMSFRHIILIILYFSTLTAAAIIGGAR